MCFTVALSLRSRSHILVRVVDIELLQEHAVVEEAIVHVGQELEDDALLGSQEDHCVVLVGPSLVVHSDARQAIPGRQTSPFTNSCAGFRTSDHSMC